MDACISYRIDAEDNLVETGGAWDSFGSENDAAELCQLRTPVSLWSFIEGEATMHLYQLMLNKVRDNHVPLTVPYRCDAPGLRRFTMLTLAPAEGGHVDFLSRMLRCEVRSDVELLVPQTQRGPSFITMCSFCKRVDCDENWLEVESAIALFRSLEQANPPLISHGACPDCFDRMMKEIAP